MNRADVNLVRSVEWVVVHIVLDHKKTFFVICHVNPIIKKGHTVCIGEELVADQVRSDGNFAKVHSLEVYLGLVLNVEKFLVVEVDSTNTSNIA